MDCIRRKAYAKINLGLDVIRHRPDGYHEVKMVMQTVDICDLLTFQKVNQPGIFLKIDQKELPDGRDNLIYKAADAILREYMPLEYGKTDGQGSTGAESAGVEITGVEITLKKQIPIAAGMAGGSSDAAAVFYGLNELFGLGMSLEDMQRIGVKLGADIPYCLMGGTALAEGIGEKLTALCAPPESHLVVAKPDINVSTKFVYENLHADRLKEHPDIDGMVKAIREGSLAGITARMGNVLETVTVREYPVIDQIKKTMLEGGAENALMSGSGPSVFGVFTDREVAAGAAEEIKKAGLAKQVFVTGFYNPEGKSRE